MQALTITQTADEFDSKRRKHATYLVYLPTQSGTGWLQIRSVGDEAFRMHVLVKLPTATNPPRHWCVAIDPRILMLVYEMPGLNPLALKSALARPFRLMSGHCSINVEKYTMKIAKTGMVHLSIIMIIAATIKSIILTCTSSVTTNPINTR